MTEKTTLHPRDRDPQHWRAVRAEAERAGNLRLAWFASAWLEHLAGRRPEPPEFAEWDRAYPSDAPPAQRVVLELRMAGERFMAAVAQLRRGRADEDDDYRRNVYWCG